MRHFGNQLVRLDRDDGERVHSGLTIPRAPVTPYAAEGEMICSKSVSSAVFGTADIADVG
jgi:hypothetical protein